MRINHLSSAILATTLTFSSINGLNILISNDDGFGTSNIREMYKAVKAFGHNVYIVASVTNQSGTGGTAVFTSSRNLTTDSEFGIVKAGAPSFGPDPSDSHIWYYNGTPSACVQVALDHIYPLLNLSTPDLVLSGPNYGWNLGPFLYTLAGTLGATYTAVERSIPAIAFSAGYSVQTPYFNVTNPTKAGLPDPATLAGRLAANLAQQLILNVAKTGGGRLLPLGYGLNVNIPYLTSFTNSSCINPPYIQTRLNGGAVVDKAVYNATTGLFKYGDIIADGVNACINGNCALPGEQNILNTGCQSSVSIFTVDYDAPDHECKGGAEDSVRALLQPLVQYQNSSGLVGGLNGTFASGNSTSGSSTSTSPVSGAGSGYTGLPVSNGAEGSGVGFSWMFGGVGVLAAAFLAL